MGDRRRHQHDDATGAELVQAVARRGRQWYVVCLTLFLLAPGIVAVALMGWLKAP